MLENLENGVVRIEASDWRWGASIVGLSKYFDHYQFKYIVKEEYIEFDQKNITKEKYLQFVESFFEDKMHHKKVEDLLRNEKLTDQEIKLVNDKISVSPIAIMKKLMGKIKYSEDNKSKILDLISESRNEIIENTFREGKALYANFCNKGNLFEEGGKICRLNGYYVDKDKKMKALSFGANKKNFISQDSRYFDFIPFAFSKTRESFFINNNFTVKQLIGSNKSDISIDENVNVSSLLYKMKNSSKFIDYDVEVIKKDRDNDYYETIFIRKKAIEIFKKIKDDTPESLKMSCNAKKNDKEQDVWVNIEKIVTESILNGIKLDNLIENLFKATNNHSFLISRLININQLIYGGEGMTKNQEKARNSALEVQRALASKKNKIRSYEQRLISSISLRDYEKVKEVLLHLSAYTQVRMDFLMDIFDDFEENKNLVYTFINTLGEKKSTYNQKKEGDGQ